MRFLLLLLAFAAVLFVWITAGGLPLVVASHFDADGAANGFMPGGVYKSLMTVLVVMPVVLLGLLPAAVIGRPGQALNVPHAAYWLAPARRAATIAWLCRRLAALAALVVVFLCYVHLLVVRANTAPVAHLPSLPFHAGLGVFFVAMAGWATDFLLHFRPPR